jgi:GTP diphosphokinase / guanosine-3',5'-bis(diphosphate) 3'-diphosphatase
MLAKYSQQIDDIIKRLSQSGTEVNGALIRRAFDFAFSAHKNVFRRSGKPYIEHPVNVAGILSEMNVDDVTIVAALLHDVVEDTDISGLEIKEKFGQTVFDIVDGVTKISEIYYDTLEEKQAENYRKLIISMIKDLRVIIIKFADRIHNLRTIRFMKPEKQIKIAKETLDIYAPLAYRLGMYKTKNELEDRSFEVIYPEQYEDIRIKLESSMEHMETYIKRITPVIIAELNRKNIRASVSGRIKHYYSIFNKLTYRKKSFEEILDLVALRIVIPDNEDCYQVLSVIHQLFKPIHGMFNDYIAAPKPNGYQSIHTKVLFENKPVEIQIRTEKMHQIAEFGLAAHWKYKSSSSDDLNAIDSYINKLRLVLQESFEAKDPKEILEELKINLILSEIFVFTPKKEMVTLPIGSTPIDFAYKIHENIGNQCIAAKRNGKIIPLNSRLENGDIVEIITSPKTHPSYNWLKFTKSPRARTSIKHYLKKVENSDTVKLGRNIFIEELGRYKIKIDRDIIKSLMKSYGFIAVEDFYYSLGSGSIKPNQLMRKLGSQKKEGFLDRLAQMVRIKSPAENFDPEAKPANIVYSTCCHPLPGDTIMGELLDSGSVAVHLATCPLLGSVEPERLVNTNWEADKNEEFEVAFRVAAEDRSNLLYDIVKIMHSMNVGLSSLDIKSENSIAIGNFVGRVKSLNHFIKIRKKLFAVPGVLSIERFVQ